MRIACPSCAAAYEVPEIRLKPRKMVRCARCGGEWSPVPQTEGAGDAPPAPQPSEPAEHEAEHEPKPAVVLAPVTAMDRLAAKPSPPPPRSTGLIGAWILTVAVLAAAISVTIVWRQEFMSVWPPSGRILAPIDDMLSKPERIAGKTAG
jgi:predicted Zn finger-like uncharacterized protein